MFQYIVKFPKMSSDHKIVQYKEDRTKRMTWTYEIRVNEESIYLVLDNNLAVSGLNTNAFASKSVVVPQANILEW